MHKGFSILFYDRKNVLEDYDENDILQYLIEKHKIIVKKKDIEEKIKQIKRTKTRNSRTEYQLDEIQYQLDLMDDSIQKAHDISSQIYFI